jgi:hypothetical protein
MELRLTLPVFDDSEMILFNRDSLVLLPKAWLKGTLRDFVFRDPADAVVVIAKAKDENSGLAQNRDSNGGCAAAISARGRHIRPQV